MDRRNPPRLSASSVLIGVIIVAGLVDAWAGKGSYYFADSMSNVEMARGFARGDFLHAVNGLFSPLYPMILAAFIGPFTSTVAGEFTAVRIADFMIFVATVLCFQAFLSRFLDKYYQEFVGASEKARPISREAFTMVAYALFAWACFSLNEVSYVSPDTCVTAIVFALLALMLSMASGNVSRKNFVLLGLLLGLAYWCKDILLPIGVLYLAVIAPRPAVRAVKERLLLTMLVFAVVAAPLVVALSVKYGQFTTGEAGKLNYAWHVNRVPHWLHWRGGPPGNGVPLHGSRQIFHDPDAYEFGYPIIATYPPWYDPAYWYAGVIARFNLLQQPRAIYRNVRFMLGFAARDWVLRLVLLAALVLVAWKNSSAFSAGSVKRFHMLWIAVLGPIGLYMLIHVEARYLCAFLSVLILLAMAAIRIDVTRAEKLLALLFVIAAALSFSQRLAGAAELLITTRGHVHNCRWNVAEELERAGIGPGTPVASIGEAWRSDWAFLGRLRVVCEIAASNHEGATPDINRFWLGSQERKLAVLRAFRCAGARLVVSNRVPVNANTAGWIQVSRCSNYYYRFLDNSLDEPGQPGCVH